MIAEMLIQEIKELVTKASKRQLDKNYVAALETLTTYELSLIRDSYMQEELDFMLMPNTHYHDHV